MDRKTMLLTSILALLLGSGTAGVAVVKPALDKRDLLRGEQNRLTAERNNLRLEVGGLTDQLSGMAMSSIAYFDLSQEPDPPRTLEAKTVESLKSITEIFNDHHINVQSMEPKGETTGSNKPIPSPIPASPSPGMAAGLANTITNLPGTEASPPPDPNAPPSPALISLVHKVYQFQVEGEYPDLVKALTEIQGLPKAISINEYKLKMVAGNADDQGGGNTASPVPGVSESLLGLDFQMSITFLLNRPTSGAPPAATPEQGASATSGQLPGLNTAWLAWVEAWCPPASAATLQTGKPPSPKAARPWRQLWGEPPRRGVAASPRPLVLAPAKAQAPRPSMRPLRNNTSLVPPARRARTQASHPRLGHVPPQSSPLAASLQGFHVVGRQGDELTLSIDPKVIHGLPEPNLATGLLAVRSAHGPNGRRLVHLGLAPGQRVRAFVNAGRLVVQPLAGLTAPVVAGQVPSAPFHADAAAEWAKAFTMPTASPLLRPSPSPRPATRTRAPQPDPLDASTEEWRRALESPAPASIQTHPPMLWAQNAAPIPLRVASANSGAQVAGRLGHLQGVELVGGALHLKIPGPRPRVWLVDRQAGKLLLAVEGIGASPKGLSHVVNSNGIHSVKIMGPGPRPNTRLVLVSHDPRLRLELHPGELGGLRLSVHQGLRLSHAADMTPAAGAALLPDRLPAGTASPNPAPMATPRVVARPTPMALPRRRVASPASSPRPQVKPVPVSSPSVLALGAAPKAMATPQASSPLRHFSLPPTSSYRFPIERDRSTGRVNPFRSLHNPVPALPPGATGDAALPVLPVLPGSPPLPPQSPGSAPTVGSMGAEKSQYTLSAVLVGGGSPPLAVIVVGDQAFQVRLNELLPGNARVKQIQSDFVVLGLNGQDLRLSLRK